MSRKSPQGDAISEFQRRSKAARRIGLNAQCVHCGENRPEALIPKSIPRICARCQRIQRRKRTTDQHHIAGKSNSPITISIPVNDHRAELSATQHRWPKETLENRYGCPLLAGAACIRGFVDTTLYCMRVLLLPIADMLEILSAYHAKKRGRRWWLNTDLKRFAPKGNSNEKQ